MKSFERTVELAQRAGVEIVQIVEQRGRATFVWSRENGAVLAYRVTWGLTKLAELDGSRLARAVHSALPIR